MMKHLFLALSCLCLSLQLPAQKITHEFALGDSVFLLNGKPFQMISGEIHYPRVPREAWRHRMRMAKAMGLNTIGTYVFWNLHEPQKGVFDFSGNNDIAAFVKTAREEGLWVVLRPSPYVCAEWEFGGYPYWLQNEKGLVVRSRESQYIAEYRMYLNELGKQLAPLQVHRGGNILLIQVENEYGAYGDDKEYLELNRKMFVEAGFDGLLFTCDPVPAVKKGYLEGLLPAINGTDRPEQIKRLVDTYHNGKGPYYAAEWYPAWFDWWGTSHHTVPAEKYAARLDTTLAAGISINMYMFHGGTTRGFMNGANHYDTAAFEPQISSYDYDAPLDEAGNATPKFMKFREVILKHLPGGTTVPDVPAAKPVMKIADIPITRSASIFDMLPPALNSDHPLTFEEMNQAYGFVLYRTTLRNTGGGMLKIKGLRDYAIVFINGKRQGILDQRLKQDSLYVEVGGKISTLDILVENMGRVNYGPYLLKNKKGITEAVLLNNTVLKNWQMFPLPFATVEDLSLPGKKPAGDAPVLKAASFELQAVADTYFDMRDWGKGFVWINGHNLGRYWEIGPQQTIYVPAEWLKKGKNEVTVLELIKPEQTILQTVTRPILDVLRSEMAAQAR